MLEEVNRLIDDVNSSVDDVREDLEVRKRLAMIAVVEGFTKLTSWLSMSFLWVLAVFGVSIFVHMALAIYLGDHWGSMALGFLAASGVFLIVSILILFVVRRKLMDITSEHLIKMLMDE